jgi:pSer/pThr/pTyr-binding forkhead associated (FHA) protein
VLSSHEVSSVHVYVRPEPGGSQTWVEDWNSLNGTYYQPGAQSASQWVQLKGKILLSRGARFRLGDNIAEFEIRAS